MGLFAIPTANREAVNTSKVTTPCPEVKPIALLASSLPQMNLESETESW